MQIQMIQEYKGLRPGDILEQADGVAELWIGFGRAQRVVAEKPAKVKRPTRRVERMVPQEVRG